MKRIFLLIILAYQRLISPSFSPRCRYRPSCSRYAYDAVELHGAFWGLLLSIYRILRCNPFSKGGYDPVPSKDLGGLW
ncbi:MAG: membrane protein insertion efficiency factor YidD [Defluviitaleaceae bacterium]|nr:membrane protein insertion efficiency factor YidD [Defluviitaleaceae bacterium]